MTKKVIIVDSLAEDAVSLLASTEGLVVEDVHGADLQGKLAAARDANAIVVRSATKIDGAFLSECQHLQIVVRAGVGVDNIDVPEATRRGVVVENVPEGNIRSAAEHTIAMLLAVCRRIPQSSMRMKEGGWDRSAFVGTEFLDKTLGVVGLGKIGRQVLQMATCLGMQTIGFDPFISKQVAEDLGLDLFEDLGELSKRADFLTIHVPLSPQTRGLVSSEVLREARPGIIVVNCARGGIIDEDALLAGLDSGVVAGAAIDVFEQEPPGLTPLVQHPKVVTTPHLGASTREAQQSVAISAARQVVDFLAHGRLTSPVNTVVLDADLKAHAAPYAELAFRLGHLQSQLLEGNPQRLRVAFYGDSFDGDVQSYIASGVVAGFLHDRSARPVNAVNARHLAADMGITVELSNEGKSRYFHRLVKVTVVDSTGRREVGGTIRGQRGLRLVTLDDYQFDAVLEGNLLLVRNEDRPGMIAVISHELAAKNVNISYMSLGRDRSGGTAVALVNLDDPIPDEIAGAVERCDGVLWARLAKLSQRS